MIVIDFKENIVKGVAWDFTCGCSLTLRIHASEAS